VLVADAARALRSLGLLGEPAGVVAPREEPVQLRAQLAEQRRITSSIAAGRHAVISDPPALERLVVLTGWLEGENRAALVALLEAVGVTVDLEEVVESAEPPPLLAMMRGD
jgi:hypothetical protein